ncbi:MAG: hypothetical protein L0196_07000 [candidate division Zixibacteria bacterium]|nr:hypothetical protein [candidate division Zixibacteria bacterium]
MRNPAKIDDVIKHFDQERYNPLKVDFPFDPELITYTTPIVGADRESCIRNVYHEWARACRHIYRRTPSHFRGIVLDLDPIAGSLSFVFGRFSEAEWRCHNYLPTYLAETNYKAHETAISFLKELEPLVDSLDVEETTGLWTPKHLRELKPAKPS